MFLIHLILPIWVLNNGEKLVPLPILWISGETCKVDRYIFSRWQLLARVVKSESIMEI